MMDGTEILTSGFKPYPSLTLVLLAPRYGGNLNLHAYNESYC